MVKAISVNMNRSGKDLANAINKAIKDLDPMTIIDKFSVILDEKNHYGTIIIEYHTYIHVPLP